jgi:hypothetical protein
MTRAARRAPPMMHAPQKPAGSSPDHMAIHPAALFTGDGRPVFPAHMRDLSPAVIRAASFSIALGGRIEDRRASHETTVASCEGGSCLISDKSSKEL